MSRSVGITSFGGYVPWHRLQRSAIAEAHSWYDPSLTSKAKGSRAIASWDEDSVTLAVEAARGCGAMDMAGSIDRLIFASTTAPFADRQNAVIVKEALNLNDSIETWDLSGSRRSGTSALLSALQAGANGATRTLCVAAERPRTLPASESELTAGDGAAAFCVGVEQVLVEFIGSHTESVDFVDEFRASGDEFSYSWESRWVRDEGYGKIALEAVRKALDKCGVDGASVKHFLFDLPVAGAAARLAKLVGIAESSVHPGLAREIGFAGAAAPLIQLVHALEAASANETIVLVSFGQGCDVLIFKTTSAIGTWQSATPLRGWVRKGRPTTNYLRYLVINEYLPVERGMRAEMDLKTALTTLYRDRKTVLGLVGARDRRTGTVQYPRSEVPLGSKTGLAADWEDYPFANKLATIASFTADRLGFYIDPPGYYGMLDFEGGGRITLDFADMEAVDAVVGRRMRVAFRIKAKDAERGFVRYFWKGVPER